MKKFCLVKLLRNMPVRACLRTKTPHSILVHDLLAIEIKIPFLKQIMSTSILIMDESWTRRGIVDSRTNSLPALFSLLGLNDEFVYQTKLSALSLPLADRLATQV